MSCCSEGSTPSRLGELAFHVGASLSLREVGTQQGLKGLEYPAQSHNHHLFWHAGTGFALPHCWGAKLLEVALRCGWDVFRSASHWKCELHIPGLRESGCFAAKVRSGGTEVLLG